MAYKAYLNNRILFFDSSVQDESFLLTAATLNLQFGGSGDFTFIIPSTNQYYDEFYRLTTYVDVYRDNQLLFSGRVYSIKEKFDLQREIKCEGVLSVLADSIFRPTLYDGTLRGLVDQILESHNNQVEDDKKIVPGILTVTNSDCYRDYQNYETSISRLADLVDSYGGFLYVTKEYDAGNTSVVDIGVVDEAIVDVGANGFVLKLNWVPDATSVCDQTIDLASNLLDIKQTVDAADIFTVLIPLGSDDDTEDGSRITIESVNSGKDYLTAGTAYLEQYGYVTQTVTWDDVHEPSILKTKGQAYLNAALVPKITINLSAVDLANAGYDIESFSIGQKIIVNSEPHGIENMQFTCHKQKLNLLDPSQNTLSLGEVVRGYVQSNFKNSASVILEETAQKYAPKTAVQLAINQATALITGNQGGYVVIHDSNNDGYPDEILVMDKPEVLDAEKVWRWNKSGLGYSSTGYNGTYGTAMTINGEIVADFITAGVMTADVIKAGILRGQSGNSYWNFVTGELYLEGDMSLYQYRNNGGGSGVNIAVRTQNGNFTTYKCGVPPYRIPKWDSCLGSTTRFESKDGANLYAIVNKSIDQYGYYDLTVSQPRYDRVVVLDRELGTYANSLAGVNIGSDIMSKDTTWVFRESITDGIFFQRMKGKDVAAAASSGTIIPSKNTVTLNVNTSSILIGSVNPDESLYQRKQAYLAVGSISGIIGNVLYCEYITGYVVIHDGTVSNKVTVDITPSRALINGNTVAYQSSSSKRYKHDIELLTDEELDPHRLYKLQSKQFRFNKDHKTQYKDLQDKLIPGFIAEDVEEIYPSAAIHNEDGQIESWDERRIIPGMLSLIQEQHEEIEELKAQIKELKEAMKAYGLVTRTE